MVNFRKTLVIAGISSILLCSTALAADNDAANSLNIQENLQSETAVDPIVLQETAQENDVKPEIQETAPTETVRQGTVTVDILNVRSGPSTDTEILYKLSLGSTVSIVSENDGWYEIVYDSNKAFVYGEYIRIIDASAAAAPSGNGVVEYAKLFIGTPYVSGGSSPSGFDCSGFVKYVMANFGIEMPRTSTDQYSIGVRVKKTELMPGDIVFFKYSASSYRLSHVGIYVGDGNFIHSPIPGQTVRIDTLSSGYFSTYYYGATRVIK